MATDAGLALENLDGSERVLVPAPTRPYSATFSPNGKLVAFTTAACPIGSPECSQLYVVGADGSNARLFANGASGASWSPDGRAVTYVGKITSGGYVGTLLVQPLAGGAPKGLVRGANASVSRPAYSPDGRAIAYDCGGTCVLTLRPRHIINLGKATKTPITGSPYFLWSPDSTRIAVNTAADFDLGLVVVNVRSLAVEQLAGIQFLDEFAYPLAWSPDSKTLLWAHLYAKLRIYESTVASGTRKRVSQNDRLWFFPRWTRNGITFLTYTGKDQPSY